MEFNSQLRLPPVDEHRQPLIEPLGHLILQSSWFDNALIEFIALLLPFGLDTTSTQVAHELRNWNDKFVRCTIEGAIGDHELVTDLHQFIDRVARLRERRHRMVHDAIEVGIEPRPSGGFRAVLLREGYQRRSKVHSEHQVDAVTPDEVVALAWAYYELRMEIDTFFGRLPRDN